MNVLIKNLQKLFDAAWEENMNDRGTDITRMVTTFIPDAIQCIDAEQPKVDGWILVSERLPEKSGFYIVTKKQKSGEIQVAIGAYQQPFNKWSGNGNFKDVIAWQPLPEPYKEG